MSKLIYKSDQDEEFELVKNLAEIRVGSVEAPAMCKRLGVTYTQQLYQFEQALHSPTLKFLKRYIHALGYAFEIRLTKMTTKESK
jgi:hypothetical protein